MFIPVVSKIDSTCMVNPVYLFFQYRRSRRCASVSIVYPGPGIGHYIYTIISSTSIMAIPFINTKILVNGSASSWSRLDYSSSRGILDCVLPFPTESRQSTPPCPLQHSGRISQNPTESLRQPATHNPTEYCRHAAVTLTAAAAVLQWQQKTHLIYDLHKNW